MLCNNRAQWAYCADSGHESFPMAGTNATVIATFSRRLRLAFDDATVVEARIKGRRLKPVCGDRVTAVPLDGESDWLVTDVHERQNELTRPNVRGHREVLASNIDRLIVVAAALPRPDWFVVDRYLCAAELMRADATVVFNKSDLGVTDEVRAGLRDYQDIGYNAFTTSAKSLERLDKLRSAIGDRRAIIVGQSGVGKSTLINCLTGDRVRQTAEISTKHREGRHTTVNSELITLPGGGAVIDSPGVRDFAPHFEDVADVMTGYREIARAATDCRFSDCRHLREPDCAVKTAVDSGGIGARRYRSYRRAIRLCNSLTKNRY